MRKRHNSYRESGEIREGISIVSFKSRLAQKGLYRVNKIGVVLDFLVCVVAFWVCIVYYLVEFVNLGLGMDSNHFLTFLEFSKSLPKLDHWDLCLLQENVQNVKKTLHMFLNIFCIHILAFWSSKILTFLERRAPKHDEDPYNKNLENLEYCINIHQKK